MIKYFKKNALVTAVGEFAYEGNIGEGGNAKVLAFKKGNLKYAVKFLSQQRAGPLARFRDEYFCAAQIPSHVNVSQAYHLDRTHIEGADYSLIVMKRYQASLHALGSIVAESDSIKADYGWKLLRALRAGIEHLHEHGIVHRDIKPQNIFFDQQKDTFVVGDLGIAHFADDLYAREAKTEGSERLANFACCAPEQLNPKTPAAPTMDVFALGQVLNWYVRGSFVRGGGRQAYLGPHKELELLDKIIDNCIQDDPKRRFQSMGDLGEFEYRARNPARDVWKPIRDLDEAFRESIPRIPEVYETSDQATINRFLTKFSNRCDPKEFWYVLSDGGDNELGAFSRLESGRWLLHRIYECCVEKLICYKYPGEWQSFFVLLLAADDPFEVTDPDGQITPRPKMTNWHQDAATFYEGRYMEVADARNGYFLHGDEMFSVDFAKAQERHRFLHRDALMIFPAGAGAVGSLDRTPSQTFLHEVATAGTTDKARIRAFIESNLSSTNPEIIERL
ncbi:protein kinase domain-containing protein [Xanthomonas tesorieronis]|uniref:protein kinase domain-containing protein n=1 Tax=Xanthomonas tesorieronis TaxID=3160839 RepID=UPI0035126D88